MERRETGHDRSSESRARRRRRERELRRRRICLGVCVTVIFLVGAVGVVLIRGDQEAVSVRNVTNESEPTTGEHEGHPLQEKSVDEILATLMQAVEDAKTIDTGIYTEESVQNLSKRRQEAEAMMEKRTYTREELETKSENILLALESLQKK